MPELSATTWVLAALLLGLTLLLIIAYAVQTAERNKRERRRLETTLRVRSRELHDVLDTLPAPLLGRDLRLLIGKGLVDIYQQLHRLHPDPSIQSVLEQVQAQCTAIAAEAESSTHIAMTHAAQIKEARALLRAVHAHVLQWYKEGQLSQAQARHHVQRLQHALVLTQLDSYQVAARQALDAGKRSLASHYHQRALERMQKHNPGGTFDSAIAQTKARIAELEADHPTPSAQSSESATVTEAEAWEAFEQSADWKKKSLYD